MKVHLTKVSLALLSTVFLLGCQEQGSGPVGPEGPQFHGPPCEKHHKKDGAVEAVAAVATRPRLPHTRSRTPETLPRFQQSSPRYRTPASRAARSRWAHLSATETVSF